MAAAPVIMMESGAGARKILDTEDTLICGEKEGHSLD